MGYVLHALRQVLRSPEARRWRRAQLGEHWRRGGLAAVLAAVFRRLRGG